MSILLSDNFQYLARKPLDSRLVYDTIAAMAAMADATVYEGAIAYNKEDKKYYTFDPTNTADATLGKWQELKFDNEGTSLKPYELSAEYTKNGLIFDSEFQLYIVKQNFTADAGTASETEPDKTANALQRDIAAGNLIQVQDDSLLDIFQEKAPMLYNITIKNGGSNYVVNNIIEVQDSNGKSVNIKVTEIDSSNGAIVKVEQTEEDVTASLGQDAEIVLTPKMYLGSLGTWSEIDLAALSGDATLTEEITSNVEVGGAPSGTTFAQGATLTEIMKKILRKAIFPKITFNASGCDTVHEIGTTMNGSILKLVINNEADVTVPMKTIEFKMNGTVIETQTYSDGVDTYTFTTTDPITSTTTFGVTLTYDEDNKKANGTSIIAFSHATYVGAVSSNNPLASDIENLQKVVLGKKAFTWDNITLNDQHYCYAYPTTLGTLTSIKDANNFEYINSYTRRGYTINGVNYYAYILTDPVTITGAKQIYA